MSSVSIMMTPTERLGVWRVAAEFVSAGGAVAAVTWRLELLGPLDEPIAQRVSEIVAGVHDPFPRYRGDQVADTTCEVIGARPCVWRPAADPADLVVAFVSEGAEALEEMMERLLGELLDAGGPSSRVSGSPY